MHGTFSALTFRLDIFEIPVTVTPQQTISKTLNSSKTSLKVLNVYFGGDRIYFWGDNVYFWGNHIYFWGNKGFSKIWGFGELLFVVARGVWGLCGSAGLIGVFENI